MLARLLAAFALLAAAPAAAEWHQATSRHFVVYADDGEADVRALAEKLERFDALLRFLHATPADTGAANRLTVYVVNGGQGAIERLCGGCRNVAGFYVGRVGGSVMFTPKRIGGGGQLDTNQQIVLFHEYAHHFMLGQFAAAPYPAWFSEGYPEFVSTARFERDRVVVGAPAYHRARGLILGQGIPIETLFAPAGRKLTPEQREAVYGRGWVLTHMCKLDAARGAQLKRYMELLGGGTPSLDAARQAFGDLKALDRAMDAYITKRTMAAEIGVDRLPIPAVALRPLTAGERAMIELRMQSTRGVDAKAAAPLFARAAPIAARFPTDPVVQTWFAEMAYNSGRDADAEAAADRALAADPTATGAMLYKGRVRVRRAVAAKATAPEVWREARSWFLRANKVDTNEAEPFVHFYGSFAAADQKPVSSAIAGLYRALELVPQDRTVRLLVARQAVLDGKLEAAREALRPLAYNPHAAPDNPAARLLQLLDAGGTAAALKVMGAGDSGTPPP